MFYGVSRSFSLISLRASVTMMAAKVGPPPPSRAKSGVSRGNIPRLNRAWGTQPNQEMAKARI